MATPDDKIKPMAHDEDVESGRPSKDTVARVHGDRALAIVGSGRVELSEEDVSLTRLPVQGNANVRLRTNESAERLIKSFSSSSSGFTSFKFWINPCSGTALFLACKPTPT